jgi:hypothetical protein
MGQKINIQQNKIIKKDIHKTLSQKGTSGNLKLAPKYQRLNNYPLCQTNLGS